MTVPDAVWIELKRHYPDRLVDALAQKARAGPFELRAKQLATEADVDERQAVTFLDGLEALGYLTSERGILCPCEQQAYLAPEEAQGESCGRCGREFGSPDLGRPAEVVVYVHTAPITRDVRWMLCLHGMNTTGAWQEEFNWMVSRAYGRAVPVAIYKYGIVRPGAILKFRHRALVRGLARRIRGLVGQSKDTGFGGVPDVIAHSLGTLLLGRALQENSDIKVGRVILTGCILRPDFNWNALLRSGQVDSVFCHTATRDFWVRIAHYIIPDSGPSGLRGFNDKGHVGHAVLNGGHHSDFFKGNRMRDFFRNFWEPFLTVPAGSAPLVSNELPTNMWRQAWWPFRATLLRLAVLTLSVVLFVFTAASLAMGLGDLYHLGQALVRTGIFPID